MKKKITLRLLLILSISIISCGQEQSTQAQSATNINNANENIAINKTINTKSTVVYAMYNGMATDDGNITGKNTNAEFHLFMKNDINIIVYVISQSNYDLWVSQKRMPAKLIPAMQTYKIDIATSKRLENEDNTVEYFEIISLNSITETDEID